MMIRPFALSLLLPLLAAPAQAAPPAQVTFQTSDELTGRDAWIHFVSNNGKVFAGGVMDGGKATVFRYSVKDGFQILPADLPPETEGVWAAGLSDEGKAVYGYLQYQKEEAPYHQAFIWTTKGGFQRIETGADVSGANVRTITGNNKFFSGSMMTGGQGQVFIWSARGGLQAYSEIHPDFPAAVANPVWVSNNLRQVWGVGTHQFGGFNTVLWTRGRSPLVYEDLPGGIESLEVTVVTKNGREAFGTSHTDLGWVAVRFLPDGKVERLFPDATYQSAPTYVSPNGRLVIGAIDRTSPSNLFQGQDSFFLDQKSGKAVLLSELISEHVPAAAEWTDMTVSRSSADGNVLIGSGWDPEGEYRNWTMSGVKKLVLPVTKKPSKR